MLHCFPLACWATVICGFPQSGAYWEVPLFYNCINTLPWAVGQIMQITLPPVESVGLKLQPNGPLCSQGIHDKEEPCFPWPHLCWFWHSFPSSKTKGRQFSARLVGLVSGTGPLGTSMSPAEVVMDRKMKRRSINPSGWWQDTLISSALRGTIALRFILSEQTTRLFWSFLFPAEVRERLWNPFCILCSLLCLKLFLALWQFVLQVVKQNVYLKINYSKILINSFFRRESHVFLCIRLVCSESEQLGLSWLLLFLALSSLHLHVENSEVFLTGIEKSFNPPDS